jgi:hypothetical protein
LPVLTEALNNNSDMVIGSRYLGAARSEDDDLLTGFGNWMFTSVINLFHRGRYTDAMVIYRAYKADLFTSSTCTKKRATLPSACAARRSASSRCCRFAARKEVCR